MPYPHSQLVGVSLAVLMGMSYLSARAVDVAAEASTAVVALATPFELLKRGECGWWNLDFAQALKRHPRSTKAKNSDGETVLHLAASLRYENEVFLLLQAGADANARDRAGRTPLHLVASNAAEDACMIRDMLVLKKADIDARDDEGWSPLMLAAKAGNLRTVEFLVWMGASLKDEPDSKLPSPRDLAMSGGFDQVAALLADAGEGEVVTLKSPSKRLPPHVVRAFTDAAAKRDYDLLGELIASGMDIDAQDNDGATALHRAVYRAHEDVVTFLLMLGANPNIADKRGNTPYMAASNWFGLSMDWFRSMLLLAGTDVHGPVNKQGYTPLDLATRNGNEESAQHLIWSGVNPAKISGTKGSPMEIACRSGSQRLIELLRRNGVTEPEWIDPVPQRRLEQYVKRGLENEVGALIATGEVSLSALTERGRTLACEATHFRNPGMVRYLLARGADPEQKNTDESTLLHATLAWNYHDINLLRQELIEQKVDIETTDNSGRTPVMKAAAHGADWIGLRQLVQAGANLAARDKKGRTALDLALQSGRSEATRYLLSVNAPYTDPEKLESE